MRENAKGGTGKDCFHSSVFLCSRSGRVCVRYLFKSYFLCYYEAVEVKIMNYTYIVRCSDGSLYTGWTNDLEKRIKDHNEGRGAKYTKARRPVVLAYYEEFATKEEAMRREWEIKQLTRAEKLKILEKQDFPFDINKKSPAAVS